MNLLVCDAFMGQVSFRKFQSSLIIPRVIQIGFDQGEEQSLFLSVVVVESTPHRPEPRHLGRMGCIFSLVGQYLWGPR
jgi:hypothetical protein